MKVGTKKNVEISRVATIIVDFAQFLTGCWRVFNFIFVSSCSFTLHIYEPTKDSLLFQLHIAVVKKPLMNIYGYQVGDWKWLKSFIYHFTTFQMKSLVVCWATCFRTLLCTINPKALCHVAVGMFTTTGICNFNLTQIRLNLHRLSSVVLSFSKSAALLEWFVDRSV